jgi:hypothetical protein
MPEQPCPACGTTYDPATGAKFCPRCGAALPEAPAAEAAPAEAPLDVNVEPQPPAAPEGLAPPVAPLVVDLGVAPEVTPVTPAAPVEPAPPVVPAAPAVADQVPCPHCGEMLYSTEKICWKCGNATEAEVPTPPARPVLPTGPVPPPPPPAPSAVPPPPPAPGVLGPPPMPGYTPGPTGPMPGTALSPEAQSAGYWALGLGIACILGLCLAPLTLAAPFAIWLGIRANRLGNTAMGLVGIICGAIGVLGLLFWIGWVALMVFAAANSKTHGALPLPSVLTAARSLLP